MLSKSSFWFAPSKGGLPVSNSNIKTPMFQISSDLSCPLYLIISGARYSGVPQYVTLSPCHLSLSLSILIYLLLYFSPSSLFSFRTLFCNLFATFLKNQV
jgi:hypothetical protein